MALNSGSSQIVKKLVQSGDLEWTPELTVHAAQSSFWDLVALGFSQTSAHSQQEMAQIAMELVRGGKFELLEDSFNKHGLGTTTSALRILLSFSSLLTLLFSFRFRYSCFPFMSH